MSPIAALLSGLFLASAALAPAAAQPLPLGSATIVNTELDFEARWARVGAADNGAFRIAWYQSFVTNAQDIRSRRLQANGTFGSESTLNAVVAGNQNRPDLAMNGSADWAAIWLSLEPLGPGNGNHLYARRTSADGTLLSGELAIDDPLETASVAFHAVDIDANDEMVVAWSAWSDTVWFERSTPAGVGMGEFPVGISNSGDRDVAVAALGDDRAVVAWTDFDGEGKGVALRCVTDTQVFGPAIPVNQTTQGNQYGPQIAAAADGHFAVVWYTSIGDFHLRARFFDRDCDALGPEWVVDDAPTIPSSGFRIGMAADGAFVVVWDILQSANDILAREFTKSGQPVGSSFSVLGAAFGSPERPDVAVGPATFAVVWNAPDFGLDDSDDVLVRRFARRVLFTDDFESGGDAAWSDVVP
ncbi:MAG: hypothetical protein KBF21_10420 [Thermoanaerobaculia bacterium]|nr:hypothetical protein [Thermoanaerobaculia bacterium]